MDNLEDLELLSKDELIEMLLERAEAGVKLSFPGKALSRRIARRVRPRVQRTVEKYSCGSEAERARNLLIEGDNLQALVTLYRERGHVDLILTDPPYNTGNDFRYNDRWDQDPNDAGLGDLVSGLRSGSWPGSGCELGPTRAVPRRRPRPRRAMASRS